MMTRLLSKLAPLLLMAALAAPAAADQRGLLYEARVVVGVRLPGVAPHYEAFRSQQLWSTESACQSAMRPAAAALETQLRQAMPTAIVAVVWRCLVSEGAYEA